jgi:hypothetical protein
MYRSIHLLPRNAGFAWEPGAFASYLCLAIFINQIRTHFSFVNNRKLWILLLALLSTQSTTGFAILIIIIILVIYNLSPKISFLLFPVSVILIIYILQLPFMYEKVKGISNFNIELLARYSRIYNTAYTAQRFASFLIDFQDFLNNPILGYGGFMEERWTFKMGAVVTSISGIGKIMARFGIVGTFFFLFSLYKTSRSLQSLFFFKGWIFPILIILAISISYNVDIPILLCFWLFYLFGEKQENKNYEIAEASETSEYPLNYR